MATRRRRLAAEFLAAFVICLAFVGPVNAVGEKKARSRADRAMRDGDFENAEKMFRDLVAKDARDKDARLGLSFALLKQRHLQEAYDQAARVILTEPLSARAHALLGAAILASGNFKNSIEEFRTALSLKEDESLAIAGLAMVDFYENRMDSAIKGLRRAVSLDSNEPDYTFNLGQATARIERYKEAADAYERFLQIAPKTDVERRARIRGLIDFLRFLGNQGLLYLLNGNKTSVPFDAIDGRPMLKVRVNGSKEYLHFVLDTGSGMSVVSEETAKKLGLRPVARGGLARAVGGGGKFEIVYGFLSSLEVGEVKVASVPVYIRHFYDKRTNVDGYLGLSVISKFIASVDYGEKILTLKRQADSINNNQSQPSPKTVGSTIPSDILEIPVRTTSSGFLSGEVRLEGVDKPLNFIIDTGASVSVVSQRLVAEEELTSYIAPIRMRVYGAAGIADDVQTVVLPKVMLGSHAREQIRAAVLDMEPVNETAGFTQNGILGGNFLGHYRVSFDFQRGVITLEPLRKTVKTSDSSTTNVVPIP
ncbi:MAG: aspartyl protease family protein [Pyrinomonadaceae bacterium]